MSKDEVRQQLARLLLVPFLLAPTAAMATTCEEFLAQVQSLQADLGADIPAIRDLNSDHAAIEGDPLTGGVIYTLDCWPDDTMVSFSATATWRGNPSREDWERGIAVGNLMAFAIWGAAAPDQTLIFGHAVLDLADDKRHGSARITSPQGTMQVTIMPSSSGGVVIHTILPAY